MEKHYNPEIVEKKIYSFWQKNNFFNPDKLKKCGVKAKSYCIVIPPPNITGELHMGHALNNTIQDILIRQKRMQGFRTLWLPGTDHAGIATQNVVEKQLRKEGLSRYKLGRKEFIKRVWEWREKYGDIILKQLKKIGVSCDWSRTRFTLDKDYTKAIEKAFAHYYKKGWIYRGKRVINWCKRCKTSLSDLEVEYKEEKSKLYYIKYGPLTLATVRPETKLGDTAVAVNPKDKRYQKYIGKTIDILSVEGKIKIKVIADDIVDPEFGTGVVKVTPAHDITDFGIGIRHNLPMRQVIDFDGKMNKLAGKYAGLGVEAARELIVKDMQKLGLIEKIEDYTHRVTKCYRCNSTIEPLPSKQWFLRMNELAKIAKEAVRSKKIKFHSKKWEKTYFSWLRDVKDWCISRQIWWGHRLPVWECQSKKIDFSKKKKYFVSLVKPKQCKICKKCAPKQVLDVLDTWFSSALWPFAALGWPKKSADLVKFYPTNFLSTDRGIINLWVARMIFSGMEFMKKIPFQDVYIHATVLTKEGQRMSKSLGTGINPMDLIEKYGADATRFGMIYQSMENQDIRFTEDHIVAGRKFCNKIWNASRFVLNQISSDFFKVNGKNLTAADKKILKSVEKTTEAINKDLASFKFGAAAHTIYNFFWHEFCDKIIEDCKKRILEAKTEKEKKIPKEILGYVFYQSLKLLHPFMPFITEEIYQKLSLKSQGALIVEDWPDFSKNKKSAVNF